ncbi:DUF1573 domain-containing protein [Flavobacterium sp. NKUCC04_CG]|uniref:DUF1573 domain-containing protein n=1 Tax=Flavobacterium sp. NKUCC04_CG TaxID=2842121 RepID=UPI001C5ABC72|nr:DUF1573 domain-containing protein [Flavobacterium sp. NKUCC04_CG]MBW3520071.1 DUF1573 domain-containing protein [Flavobacterium sp. NKUCC04_CG]
MIKRYYITCCLVLTLMSCNSDLTKHKTNIEIQDNNRHYSPILYEQMIELVYKIKNTGKAPLVISDIFTSCACIVINDGTTKMIPIGKEGFIRLSYTASMNIGYAKHHISIFGNFEDNEPRELIFDIHIVPSQLLIKDYEDVFREENLKKGGLKTFIDGDESHKGYYVDE